MYVGFVPHPPQKMSAAEQAEAMIEHLDRLMEALEQDKITGARSVRMKGRSLFNDFNAVILIQCSILILL